MLVDKKREKKQTIRVNDNTDSSTKTKKSNSAIEKTASVKIDDLVCSKLTGWPYWPSTVILFLQELEDDIVEIFHQ